MVVSIINMIMIMMLVQGWRPPCGGNGSRRDTAVKVIAIHFADIQSWGKC